MTITKTIKLDELPKVLAQIKARRMQAKLNAYNDFVHNKLKDHFSSGNTMNYNILPNKIEYATWKVTHGYGSIVCVKTGTLKKAAINFTRVVISPSGRTQLFFQVPQYGKYLIKMKKDWKSLNNDDRRYIRRRIRFFMKTSRK